MTYKENFVSWPLGFVPEKWQRKETDQLTGVKRRS